MTLVNDFLVGADPEFVSIDPPNIHLHDIYHFPRHPFYGFDHQGYVVEPHPLPSKSCREVVKNIKAGLETFAHHEKSSRKWRAGAYWSALNRSITLGGHVHIDKPAVTAEQIGNMDKFALALEKLEITPSMECNLRRTRGEYGDWSDVRREHGHFEYRTLPSWLYSTKTALLAMTGIKLAFLDKPPATIKNSYGDLKNWFERFKGKDDDVDWILEKDYFDSDMEAKPDRDIKSVWKLDPKEHTALVPTARELNQAEARLNLVFHPFETRVG